MRYRFNNELLRTLRLQWGCTAEELAHHLEVDVTTLRNYESGRVNTPFFAMHRAARYQILVAMVGFFQLKDVHELLIPEGKDPETGPFEPPGTRLTGGLPTDCPYYIRRAADDRFEKALEGGESILLLSGARQTGKTSLLARGTALAQKAGSRILRTDLQAFAQQTLETAESFLLALSDQLAEQLQLEVDPVDEWRDHRGANQNFERFVRRHVLRPDHGQVFWAMDEVDRLFGCSFGSDIFGLFRSWYNTRALDPSSPYRRLTLVLSYATDVRRAIADINQSPFNVGTRVVLGDFNLEQVRLLNKRYGTPLASEEEVQGLYHLLGGQPYLLQSGLYALTAEGMCLKDLESAPETGIFGDHLGRLRTYVEAFPPLTEGLRALLFAAGNLSDAAFNGLRVAGVVAGEAKEEAWIRCELYRRYFERILT